MTYEQWNFTAVVGQAPIEALSQHQRQRLGRPVDRLVVDMLPHTAMNRSCLPLPRKASSYTPAPSNIIVVTAVTLITLDVFKVHTG